MTATSLAKTGARRVMVVINRTVPGLPYRLVWKPSPLHGYGIFAGEDIPAREPIFWIDGMLKDPCYRGEGSVGPDVMKQPFSIFLDSFNFGLDVFPMEGRQSKKRPTTRVEAVAAGYPETIPFANLVNISQGDACGCMTTRPIRKGEELLCPLPLDIADFERERIIGIRRPGNINRVRDALFLEGGRPSAMKRAMEEWAER